MVEFVVIVFFANFAVYAMEVVWGSYRAPGLYKYDINVIKVIIEEGEDGWYVVEVPALPGCISQGKTKK